MNAECRQVGPSGTAVYQYNPADGSCKTVGTYWLKQGAFFDWNPSVASAKVVCKKGSFDPTGQFANRGLVKFQRAQNVALPANAYYIADAAAVYCATGTGS